MKKLPALILSAVLIVSLAACSGGSGGNGIDKNSADSYIGVWESANMRFTINKGGVGRYEQPNDDNTGFFDFTYEIADEVMTITIESMVQDYVASFELNDDGTALTILHNGLPSYYKDETEFTKVASE